MEVDMEKCDIRFYTRLITVIMITLGMLCFTAHHIEAQSGKAYVSTQDGTKMLVFSLTNHNLIKTIPIYTATPLGQALPPNINDVLAVGNRIFMTVPGPEISAAGINELKVIDSRSDTILATLKTGLTPSGLLEYKGRVYVVNRYGNSIQEIDPDTLKVVRTIPFTAPKQMALNNPISMEIVNDKIYLPFPGGLERPGVIQVMDLKTGAPLKAIDFTPVSPYGPLAIKKVGEGKIYLGGAQSVAVLDTQTDKIIKTIILSGRDINVQSFTLSGGKVYAANGVSTVSVIDPLNDLFITEIDIGYHAYAYHLKAGSAAVGNKIIVVDAGHGIKVIDTVNDRFVMTIASDEPLGPIAIIP
jgi:YVTN family beta-propeller protein